VPASATEPRSADAAVSAAPKRSIPVNVVAAARALAEIQPRVLPGNRNFTIAIPNFEQFVEGIYEVALADSLAPQAALIRVLKARAKALAESSSTTGEPETQQADDSNADVQSSAAG
jgi:hypothetical protein